MNQFRSSVVFFSDSGRAKEIVAACLVGIGSEIGCSVPCCKFLLSSFGHRLRKQAYFMSRFRACGGNNSFLTCVSNLNTPSLGESNS